MVSPEVPGAVVVGVVARAGGVVGVAAKAGAVVDGVAARTLVCIVVVESSDGAVAVSVDLISCDLVNGVVDEMSLSYSADVDVELLIMSMVVGSEEALTRGLEAVDTTRSKTTIKTI